MPGRRIATVAAAGLLAAVLLCGPAAGQDVGTFGGTPVGASSGNVAAATATATLAAVAGKTTYLCGFSITGGGATAASLVQPTVVGLIGGTFTYTIAVPAGVTLGIPAMNRSFNPCMPASAPNVSIVVSSPTFGAGNTNVTINAEGYYK